MKSRIVPQDRHNIVEVLQANNLASYDEVSLLASCGGRSSDDDLLAYEFALPDDMAREIESSWPADANFQKRDEALDSGAQKSWADDIIDSLVRQRAGGEIRYAFVKLPPTSDDANHRASRNAASTQGGNPAAHAIGAMIREKRLNLGLTQAQLAHRAGITQTVLSRVESGRGNPTLSLLEDIAAALDAQLKVSL